MAGETTGAAVAVGERANAERMKPAQRKALAAFCFGYFMVILDTTVVNVALSDIQRDLRASFAGLQWVVDAYALVFASLLLTGGGLADRLDARRAYLLGFALFVGASVLCGIASSLSMLVIARAAQGVGASLMLPASLSLLRALFSTPAVRASAIAVWAATAGVAAGSGPLVGGVLVDTFGWRSAFLVNLPVGLLGLLITVKHTTAIPVKVRGRLDVIGPIASVLALGGLTAAFIVAGAEGRRNLIVFAALVLALIGAIGLIVAEARSDRPMLPLDLFKLPGFSAATVIGFALNFGFYGQLFLMALYFQTSRGLSPSATGLALLPETGVALFANVVAGKVTAARGPRWPMAAGLLLSSVGLLALIPTTTGEGYVWLACALGLVGFGAALAVPAVTASMLEIAPRHQAGISAAVLNSGRQMGGVLGVAVLGALAAGPGSTLPALRTALVAAAVAMLLGCAISLMSGRSPSRALTVHGVRDQGVK